MITENDWFERRVCAFVTWTLICALTLRFNWIAVPIAKLWIVAYVYICLHEAAHYVTARALGLPVSLVEVGGGATAADFVARGEHFRFGICPFMSVKSQDNMNGGVTLVVFRGHKRVWRFAVFAFAGNAADLAILVASAFALPFWCTLWIASRAIANTLFRDSDLRHGMAVLKTGRPMTLRKGS